MEFKNILDINIDVEARDLSELMEDAFSDHSFLNEFLQVHRLF